MSARSIFAVACSFLALTVFACAKGSTGGFGGAGGEGGEEWGGPAQGPGPSSSSSGSGGGGVGGGGGGVGGGSGACDNKGLCADCADCSVTTGSCVNAYDTCAANPDCPALVQCLDGCASGDNTCIDNCATIYSAGVNDLIAYQDCVVCVDCPVDCDAATYMCP